MIIKLQWYMTKSTHTHTHTLTHTRTHTHTHTLSHTHKYTHTHTHTHTLSHTHTHTNTHTHTHSHAYTYNRTHTHSHAHTHTTRTPTHTRTPAHLDFKILYPHIFKDSKVIKLQVVSAGLRFREQSNLCEKRKIKHRFKLRVVGIKMLEKILITYYPVEEGIK